MFVAGNDVWPSPSPTVPKNVSLESQLMRLEGLSGLESESSLNPGGCDVESTSRNWSNGLRKRVADSKHGFESRWGHHYSSTAESARQEAAKRRLPAVLVQPISARRERHASHAGHWGCQSRVRVTYCRWPGRRADTIPATPPGMNRIDSTRSAPNTVGARSWDTMLAMSGQN